MKPLLQSAEEARHKGAETAAKRRERKDLVISGEYASTGDIMRRFGCNRTQAAARLKRAREKPGPLTWEALGA